MQVAQIDFQWSKDASSPRQQEPIEQIEQIGNLLGCWRSHGQIASDAFPCIETPGGLRYWLMLPHADSLARQHDSRYARRWRQVLEDQGARIEIEVLAPDAEGLEPCACSTHDSLLLYTNYISLESPLRCGQCFGPIPLYEIPRQADSQGEIHDEIRSWISNYHSCDRLQMNCAVGEHWALRQMGRHKSKLSRQGRKLCRRLEKLLGVPVYYYLHRYYGKSWKREETRRCPRCGSDWRLQAQEHSLFDFRCDRCRLLSNIAYTLKD